MLNWLTVWGAIQAVGLIFKVILEEVAKEVATDGTNLLLHGIPNKILNQLPKEELGITAGKALKEFLQLLQQQLKVRCKLSDDEIKSYTEDVRKFTKDKYVREILGQAFDIHCEHLNAKSLEEAWQRLRLQSLPYRFNWQILIDQYLIQVQELLLESDTLRFFLTSEQSSNFAENAGIVIEPMVSFNLAKYQESIREIYGDIKLDSLDTSGYAYRNLKLWRMFIPQNVRETHQFLPQLHELPKEYFRRLRESDELALEISHEELAGQNSLYLEQPIRSVLDVINEKHIYKYIVILGYPGSGKSTLLQYLALNWAESSQDNLMLFPIPLLIELRNYMRLRENGECENFLDFFTQCRNTTAQLNQVKLQEQLKAGNALVMFDGLDEVFDLRLRDEIINDIHSFINDYPYVQVIVTSRIIGYEPQRFSNTNFHHFILQDLEPEQIQDFIYRWHELTFSDVADKARKRERLQEAINTVKSIAELAGNPLLLTMMAILNRNQELPRDRNELYNQASKVLLHQWDVERALVEGNRLDKKTIDYKDKQAILRQVAYYMQNSHPGLAGNLIRENELEKILIDYLTIREFEQPREVAQMMINQMRTRNFMLSFLGADYYAFVHRTFLEYFCAWEFVWQFKETQTLTIEQMKYEVFGQHWQDERWHELLLLISAMIEPKFVGEILVYLMGQNGEEFEFRNLFLAAKCLAEVRNRSGIISISNQLFERLNALTKYDLSYDYVPYRDEEETKLVQEIRTQAVAAIAMTWAESSDTKIWLQQHAASDDDSDVRCAAVEGFAHSFKDDPNTKTWLQERAINDAHWAVRRAAVQEFARGFKDDPDNKTWLQQRAVHDDHWAVRVVAVQEFARSFPNDPDNKTWLQQRAVHDDHWAVRVVAVQEFVRSFPNDPNTKTWLQQQAINDDDSDVRVVAVQEFARSFPNDRNTQTWLQQRATNDDDSDVRRAALEGLAHSFQYDPDTKIWLQQRAIQDNHWAVRVVAVQELVRSFPEQSDTKNWLQQRAINDDNSDVRRAALEGLARCFPQDHEIKLILKQSATDDDDSDVRIVAIQELVHSFLVDPDIKIWLKERTMHDESAGIRCAAMEELVRYFKDDPDTKSILKQRAIQDDNEYVRLVAVEELVCSFKDDPDTKSILKQQATQDNSASVRGAAVEELARSFQDDRDLFAIYYNCAVNDPFEVQPDYEGNPRKIALQIIVQHFPQHPDTLPLLRDRAANDPDEQLRNFAQNQLQQWQE
ncbi:MULTISPECIES: HEAT repeat domain-containing protein [unclassified Tolypothrix]|uniref:HEAT repeat domain-containing protein n=1 Tax=unclassified Tolypothrix TaxID=2649714 RepID=UPI0005EAC7CE|nr:MULTISPECIES: HEAT repeat domain-containing protein [unclassified Tolypothrix]BAY90734.1 signal transduction protein [Microchaete diplosiphon NIES-3275]EKF04436.1 NACHT domain protein [Tolypothrix sp. PCC 7601]MBE9081060.1 HEAT repeat domain-containing protein [Tolypothrix sp. LEGE 11397]UYD24875.1 HEAT repeat domain-containing protein [Tolypothrix sp. PCC 7712]UYD32893.1 HEAT repeat domain-containing protein [Tolypothrix sp. PCC 7601]